LLSFLRSALQFSPKSYRFSRPPSRLTLAVAGAVAAVLAIVAVALALAGGNPAPGQPAAKGAGLAPANSAAAARPASGGPASGQAPQHAQAVPAARPASLQSAAQHGQAASQDQATAKQAPAAQAAPDPQPFLVYDSVNPQAIPGNPVVATYATGANPDYPSQVAGFSHVLWIDVEASDPNANALDIEPGCASPSQAAGWVYDRLTAHPHSTAILYTMMSDWSEVQADVSTLPSWMQSHIRWWIADPTGTPHIVPGSQATQWYWGPNYDISTALPGF
jgi:hypothetical protein